MLIAIAAIHFDLPLSGLLSHTQKTLDTLYNLHWTLSVCDVKPTNQQNKKPQHLGFPRGPPPWY